MRKQKRVKVAEKKQEKNDKTLSEISLNNKNNFEEIIKNLSIGEHYITTYQIKMIKKNISINYQEDTKNI